MTGNKNIDQKNGLLSGMIRKWHSIPLLVIGTLLIHIAITYYENRFEFGTAIFIGVIGFLFCIMAVASILDYATEWLSGKRERRIQTNTEPPQSAWHDFILGILMLSLGALLVLASFLLFGTYLDKTISVVLGLFGFFMARLSLDVFFQAAIGPVVRKLWSFSLFQYIALAGMFLILLYAIFEAYKAIVE